MPARVRAFCHLGKYHNIEVEDEVTAYFEYASGASGVFITSTGEAPGTNRLEITGERGKLVSEAGRLSFTRNEVPMSQFSRETPERFGMPPVWNVEIPTPGATTELHANIMNNFVAAVLDGAPLIAPAEEGLRSVELVRRAKREGVRVTAEVTPHHLVFTDEDLLTYDTNRKVNPPLRSAEDRDALRAGVADGTIDAIATDHAPHAIEEKEAEFDQAPPGTIGLETALAAVLTELVEPGIFPLPRALEALSSGPARILGANEHGGPIEPGRPANLVVFDPVATWVVEAPFASKSRNSAFLGRRLTGRVVHTMLHGELSVGDGKATR
jgi:dihydroorotase